MRRIQKLIRGLGAGGRARDRGICTAEVSHRVAQTRASPRGLRRLVATILRPSAALTLGVLGALGVMLDAWVRGARRQDAAGKSALLRRDRILEAVGSGAERLLRFMNGNRLNEFLALLGEATGTSRVYVFQNHRNDKGEWVASQRFEWAAAGVPAQIDNPALQGASYEALGMRRWKMELRRGHAILGMVDQFPESEQVVLKSQGIRSLLVLPIFIGAEWWGFIGFDENRHDRWWSRTEVDALRTSAGLVAAAIERDRADERMQQLERARFERGAARAAERRSRFLAEASRVFGSTLKYGTVFEQLAQLVVPELGDWCVIDVLEDGSVRRAAVTNADPDESPLAERILQSVPRRQPSNPIVQTLESGSSRIVARISDTAIRQHAPEGEPEIGERSAIIVPLRAEGGVVAAMTLLAAESREYEVDDLALADELAGRASLALVNACLYSEARRATRIRDEMLAVVSHDLRNPLHTISLSAGLLEETAAFEGEAGKQLEIINRSVQRADRLIDDLLNVARLEAGTFALERRPVSSREVALEALELHRNQALEAKQDLISELPEQLPDVSADRDRLLEVFGNLLGNAIKFTDEGGEMRLGAEATDDGVRFWVADTGRGIPADQLPHLFDPFWQAARRREGAGLGLSIARGIVEAHAGRIRAESEEGVGTTISFTIPTGELEESTGGQAARREDAAD